MKPNLKIICSTLIILITIFFLTIYVTTHISDFKTLSNIGLSNFYFIFLIFIFNITFIILNGLYLDILMKPFGLKLKQRESYLEGELRELGTQAGKEKEVIKKFDLVREGEKLAVIVDSDPASSETEAKPGFFKRLFNKG